ncbi:MAG: Nif3-like dinuclear metal center hexameric protein [Firmicutes bacterium]|jgi:dinuclear metal center YbgI/SA1388 family protein|nr:Nif3-like dinuclear metal center hexameric protein [Bacillota bacterium]
MIVNSKKVVKILDGMFPERLAYDWDNVGFQVGDMNHQIRKILLALELNREVLDEAIENNIDLIITHHPFIFKGIKKVVSSDYTGGILMDMIKNNISLYVSHTNMDIASGGTNDYLAKLLEVRNLKNIEKTYSKTYYKIVVYIPEENLDEFRGKILASGVGTIGNYDSCSFSSSGVGTFRPLENSNPYLGKQGEMEYVKEYKFEFMAGQDQLNSVVDKIKKYHPYEEVAIDIIKIENEMETLGLGRYGDLENMSLKDLGLRVKEVLGLEGVNVVGDLDKPIRKVAICSGAGSDLIKRAKSLKCDVLITGDLKYHEAQDAVNMGMAVIDGGHYGTENIYMEELKKKLSNIIEEKDYNLKVYVSSKNINPMKLL